MKFVKIGGTNVIKQNNLKGNCAAQTVGTKRRNRRAPAKRGVWAFPNGLIDMARTVRAQYRASCKHICAYYGYY